MRLYSSHFRIQHPHLSSPVPSLSSTVFLKFRLLFHALVVIILFTVSLVFYLISVTSIPSQLSSLFPVIYTVILFTSILQYLPELYHYLQQHPSLVSATPFICLVIIIKFSIFLNCSLMLPCFQQHPLTLLAYIHASALILLSNLRYISSPIRHYPQYHPLT